MRAIAYVRCSTAEQSENGSSLEAQRHAITTECARRGWELVDVIEDRGKSARNLNRPGVKTALKKLKRHEADALIASKLDRLSRSVLDFAALMESAQKENWSLVVLDLNVDTTTPAGEAMANLLATFAQFERKLIGQRTKEGLAIKKRQGVRLGRPPTLPESVRNRIRKERRSGASYGRIAALLEAESVPTAHGGRWHAETIRKICA